MAGPAFPRVTGMQLIQRNPDLSAYLAADEAIDHDHPLVRETAARLRTTEGGAYAYAKAAYEFVRDEIPHSCDTGDQRVTWRASDVIGQRTGICYAKSHALAALLRAESIPTALCYQEFDVVHGLVAIRLPGRERWDRQDARGNKPGWTPTSRWTASSWPSPPSRSSARRTTRSCSRPRIRRSCGRCGPLLTSITWSGRCPPRCAETVQAPGLAGSLLGAPRGRGNGQALVAGRPVSASRTSAAVGAVPPRCAGTHQVSFASLGRTG